MNFKEQIAKHWSLLLLLAIGVVVYMEVKKPEYLGANIASKLEGVIRKQWMLIGGLGLAYTFTKIK